MEKGNKTWAKGQAKEKMEGLMVFTIGCLIRARRRINTVFTFFLFFSFVFPVTWEVFANGPSAIRVLTGKGVAFSQVTDRLICKDKEEAEEILSDILYEVCEELGIDTLPSLTVKVYRRHMDIRRMHKTNYPAAYVNRRGPKRVRAFFIPTDRTVHITLHDLRTTTLAHEFVHGALYAAYREPPNKCIQEIIAMAVEEKLKNRISAMWNFRAKGAIF